MMSSPPGPKAVFETRYVSQPGDVECSQIVYSVGSVFHEKKLLLARREVVGLYEEKASVSERI